MMRRVLDQVIWRLGTYRFETRERMYRTIVDARQALGALLEARVDVP